MLSRGCPIGPEFGRFQRFSDGLVKRLDRSLIGGVADQGIVSLGNFALTVILARGLPAAGYGLFSVALSFLLFFNTLHQALITYPLSVHSAGASPRETPRLLAVAALLTPLAALVCAPMLAGGLASVGHLSLAPLAFAALLAWQLQDVARRAALARADYRGAIVTDLIRYIGPAIALLALSGHLSVEDAFILIAVASLGGLLPFLPSLIKGIGPASHGFGKELIGHWRLAAPVLGANLLAALSVQWFLWLLAWRGDPKGAALLVALTNIVAIANPIIFGVENVLLPEVARAQPHLTFAGLLRLMGQRGLLCGGLIAPLFLLILAFPERTARLFYGAATPYADHAVELRLLVAAYVCILAAFIFSAVLRGYRASGAVFRMQLYPALFGLTAGSWLTWQYGVPGACLSALLAGLVRAGVGFQSVLRLRGAAPVLLAVP